MFISFLISMANFKKSPLEIMIMIILVSIYMSFFLMMKMNLKFFLIILILIFLGGLMVMFSFFISSSFFLKPYNLGYSMALIFLIFFTLSSKLNLNFKEVFSSFVFLNKGILIFFISILLYMLIYFVKLNLIKVFLPFKSIF